MITLKRTINPFTDNAIVYADKDGNPFAIKENGSWTFEKDMKKYDSLTRAQGYKYWKKYFNERYFWALPEMLQDAIDLPPRSCGTFLRNSELWGYEG